MDRYEEDIKLATAAQEFLSSPLGRRISELAGQEIDRCLNELKTAASMEQIKRLQDTIRRNETLGTWIVEIIHLGNEAKGMLAEEEG